MIFTLDTAGKTARALWFALFLLHGAQAQTTDQMQFTVQALSPVLSVSQPLATRLRITNRSQTPMYVFNDLNYYVSVWAYAGSKESMRKQIIEEAMPPPPRRENFTLLKPGQSVEDIRYDKLDDLGISKPGNYRIDFNYRMNLPREFTLGLPVWQGTQGASALIRVVNPSHGHTR
ncbi:hypothetical protein [Massilia phyllosphaerae]|uniref:hypothetical protein n=1 Tax=Massilia phyllosphaerae TaxID=3106034 RepID=UPI002B1CC018|nr:hypothetical protein [Massilia sp. SGZ-792]